MSILLTNIIYIFVPVFIVLLLIAIAAAALVLAAENDVNSDKYYKARSAPDQKTQVLEKYCTNQKCSEDVYAFINLLYEIFPFDFIIVPNVKLSALISSSKTQEVFEKKLTKNIIDVGIFYKNKTPLVLIDLIDKNSQVKNMQQLTLEVAQVLKTIKLPVAQVVMKKKFNQQKLKHEILSLMPTKIKKKYM